MQVDLSPEIEAQLDQLADATGRSKNDFVQDAMTAYLGELTELRNTVNSRYDDMESGRVEAVDGESFFNALRDREEQLRKRRSE